MNIHHLELFYFVAKHGGIAAAVRNIPYGIQQPAVSAQIARLEESLGTKLFQRRPFALSPAGVELFEFIRPFFDNVEIIAEKLRQNRSPQFPNFAFICMKRRALKRKDYSWLGTLILRLPLSRKNRVLGFRFGHYLSCR
jgi:DNA-binding transcriptional LysR family regulator